MAFSGEAALAIAPTDEALLGAVSDSPMTTELVRHVSNYDEQTWWNDLDGRTLGVVHRNSWNQWLRYHYVLRNVAGDKISEASQPWSWGVLIASMAQLYVTDATGQVLVHMQGIFWTKAGKRFKLTDATERYIGDAWVDSSGQSVAFSYANQQNNRFASLVRNNNGSGTGRWRMQVLDPAALPADAWPILGAFFSHDSDRLIEQAQSNKAWRERHDEQQRWDALADKLGAHLNQRQGGSRRRY